MLGSSTIGSITTDMAQHRLMAILLFVCLSLCFEVAQSQSQIEPCLTSAQCSTECCLRSSPQGSGQCVTRFSPCQSCYGPNDRDRCYNSTECTSGCCQIYDFVTNARCVQNDSGNENCIGSNDGDSCYSSAGCKSGCCARTDFLRTIPKCRQKEEGLKCFGPNNGDRCDISAACNSGCCRMRVSETDADISSCEARAVENAPCRTRPVRGFYDFCPCASGLTCEGIFKDSFSGFCKKPSSK